MAVILQQANRLLCRSNYVSRSVLIKEVKTDTEDEEEKLVR